jgi:hypothetical protein
LFDVYDLTKATRVFWLFFKRRHMSHAIVA